LPTVLSASLKWAEFGLSAGLLSHSDLELVTAIERLKQPALTRIADVLSAIQGRRVEILEARRRNKYFIYLGGGEKPLVSGKPDWHAKEDFFSLELSLRTLEALEERLVTSGTDDSLFARIATARAMTEMFASLSQTATRTSRMHELTNPDLDARLCLAWNGTNAAAVAVFDLEERLGEYHAQRLMSARAAEHIAMDYFQSLNLFVEDVSVLQLGKGSDNRWKLCDLFVDGLPIDIKNSRRSFSSPHYYVEHCIPRFKSDRNSGDDVRIVGVLSEYLSFSEIIDCARGTILGEVSGSELRSVCRWMSRRFEHVLDLRGMWRPGFLPGWVFEYRPAHYVRRDSAIESITGLLDEGARWGWQNKGLPGWLSVLTSKPSDALPDRSESSELVRSIRSLLRENRCTRPALYLFVMGYIAEAIIQGSADSAHLRQAINSVVFVRGSEADQSQAALPLGLEDSQRYIENLVESMLMVMDSLSHEKIVVDSFRLVHPHILQARRLSGEWMTVLAYCGGWKSRPRVKCGAFPLRLGEHAVCPSCSHLACNKCGFCWAGCQLCEERQRERAADPGSDRSNRAN
jgi:hypothetical protein